MGLPADGARYATGGVRRSRVATDYQRVQEDHDNGRCKVLYISSIESTAAYDDAEESNTNCS